MHPSRTGVGRWFAHFKLSGAALVASCAAAWFAFPWLLRWLVYPALQLWGPKAADVPLHFANANDLWRTKLLVVVIFAVLAILPTLASDVWGLLRPRMNARAARLRTPFALATALVAVLTLLLIRDLAPDAYAFLAALSPAEL